jgi:acetylornithine deacetylase/succinyl-diaminopimelate desuccinylase-like protein
MSFDVRCEPGASAQVEPLLHDCLQAGLAGYVGLYGDKTKVTDTGTGRPMVARHYDCRRTSMGFQVDVYGATGHMGAIRERDGAITKAAHLVRSLVASKARLQTVAGGPVRFELTGALPGGSLVLEGGQGFVPTHDINEVMERLRRAACRGAEHYLRRLGRCERGEHAVAVSYEKLHNTAFDGDPASPAVRNAIAARRACGFPQQAPVLGWTVSCDARLFASEYPQMPVLTFGPGSLAFAHSDQEQIDVDDLLKAAGFLALFLLRQTGTVAWTSNPK